MMNTITENRLKNNVKAFLDYVTYQKQPVLVARDDGNVVMIPEEMYEAVEEYMQMREAQELAGPRALPQAEPMMKKVSPDAGKDASEHADVDKPEGMPNDAIDWSLFPEAEEALRQDKQEQPEEQEKPKTYTFDKPKAAKEQAAPDEPSAKAAAQTEAAQDDDEEDDDPEFAALRQQIADKVAASLKAKGIYLPPEAFNKLVDEAINEIARGNLGFLQQIDDLPPADGYRG